MNLIFPKARPTSVVGSVTDKATGSTGVDTSKPRSEREQLYLALKEAERRMCEGSLHAFLQSCWHIIEPGREFIDNWHLQAICDHLEAVSSRQITRLLINVPFRTSKSTITSVAWPAWTWINQPNHQWLCGSYAEKLAIRDSLKMRRLITSPWYRSHWADKFGLASDQNQKVRFQNDHQGYRIAFGMTGGVMGDGGDTLLIDDPHDRQGAHSEAERENALTTYDEALITRLNDPITGAIVIIMQRLHRKDLSGHVLDLGGFEHLMLPMEYEPARSKVTSLGFKDPRTKPGELLWPKRFDAKTVASLQRGLGSYGTAGQLQQRPSPDGGGILETKYFKLWPASKPLPDLFFIVQSYDTAFTERTEGDPTACTVWGIGELVVDGSVVRFSLLLDAWTEHISYPKLRKKVMDDWKAEYGGIKDDPMHPPRKADVILVEEKGSGISLLQDLRQANVAVRGYNPGKADKIARAHMAAPLLEAGLCYVLESKRDPGKPVTWARPLMTQSEEFPNGEHDDLVDTFTQAHIYLRDAGMLELDSVPADEVNERDYYAERKAGTNPYAA
jgi:predicted phage terminase large subunit-like protein